MTLRTYRRIGQWAVGTAFANRTARRWLRDALADGNQCDGPARFTEKDLNGLLVAGDAGSTPSGVSLQEHDELALHDAEHCVVSSCRCVLAVLAQQLSKLASSTVMRPFGSSHWISPAVPQAYANSAIQAATSCMDCLFNAEGSWKSTRVDSTASRQYLIPVNRLRANLPSDSGRRDTIGGDR